ncbi:hypothetical protein AA313_de0201762 [Arthrobotrys entomopaga]|nr:hypothetical protein AA313_de0201762 [Arthrobotrys entomopaga]
MGNLLSTKDRYIPRNDPQRPKDRIFLFDTLGNDDVQPFYVDFDDPQSLERELRRFNMAGKRNTEHTIWQFIPASLSAKRHKNFLERERRLRLENNTSEETETEEQDVNATEHSEQKKKKKNTLKKEHID